MALAGELRLDSRTEDVPMRDILSRSAILNVPWSCEILNRWN